MLRFHFSREALPSIAYGLLTLLIALLLNFVPSPTPLHYLYWLALGGLIADGLERKRFWQLVVIVPLVIFLSIHITVLGALVGRVGWKVWVAATIAVGFFSLILYGLTGWAALRAARKTIWPGLFVWALGYMVSYEILDVLGLAQHVMSATLYTSVWAHVTMPVLPGLFFAGVALAGSTLMALYHKKRFLLFVVILVLSGLHLFTSIDGNPVAVHLLSINSPPNEEEDLAREAALLDEYLEAMKEIKTEPDMPNVVILPGAGIRYLNDIPHAMPRLWQACRDGGFSLLLYSYHDDPYGIDGHFVYSFTPDEPPIRHKKFHFIPFVEYELGFENALTMPIAQSIGKHEEGGLTVGREPDWGISICFEACSASMLRPLKGAQAIAVLASHRDVRGDFINVWTRDNAQRISMELPAKPVIVTAANGWMGIAISGSIQAESPYQPSTRKRCLKHVIRYR